MADTFDYDVFIYGDAHGRIMFRQREILTACAASLGGSSRLRGRSICA